MCTHAHKCVYAGKRVGLAATPSTQASHRCALESDAFTIFYLKKIHSPFHHLPYFVLLVGGFPSQNGLKLVMMNGTRVFFLQGFPGSYVSEPSVMPQWMIQSGEIAFVSTSG